VGIIALLNLRNYWTKVHQTFFVERGRECCSAPGFQIINISARSRDICTQSGNGSKIVPNLARFSPPKFFWGAGSQAFRLAFVNWTCFRPYDKISQRLAHEPQKSRNEKKKNCSKT